MPEATNHITEAQLRVQAVRRVVEHDLTFGSGSLDADTTWWTAQMLARAERHLEIAQWPVAA